MSNQRTTNLEDTISKNPRLVLYLISVLVGLLFGYMFESEGKINSPLVLIPVILVIPASIGIFREVLRKIK